MRRVNSALYTGWVRHRRFAPVSHVFRYRALALAIDLDDLPQIRLWPLLGIDRFGLMSFRQRDYLDGDLTRMPAGSDSHLLAGLAVVSEGRSIHSASALVERGAHD